VSRRARQGRWLTVKLVTPLVVKPKPASAALLNFGISGGRRCAVPLCAVLIVAICQEQLPNVQITETFKPFGDIWTANIAAVAAGTGMPDIIVEDRPHTNTSTAAYRHNTSRITRCGINLYRHRLSRSSAG
jgi:hypothetical protein